jgi:flavin-dependent dehydrogenase
MYDLIVIGGGPAGTAAAITGAYLRALGGPPAQNLPPAESPRGTGGILLLERGNFPRQKVCGEFVSAEATRILRELLGNEVEFLDCSPRIRHVRLYAGSREFAFPITPAASSITRWELDHKLWQAAVQAGVDSRQGCEVTDVQRKDNVFAAITPQETFLGRTVIDASGRWSTLNARNRRARGGRLHQAHWIGLKAHFNIQAPRRAADLPTPGAESTDLYFFPGGYCGVQPSGEGRLNVCAMVRAERAVRLARVLELHPLLRERSRNWTPFTREVVTAPLGFHARRPQRAGMLCAGDTAGFIDPFVGDGILLALRSGRLAAQILSPVWNTAITLDEAVSRYSRAYRQQFSRVFYAAACLRLALSAPPWLRLILLQGLRLPHVARLVFKSTR